MKVSQAGSSKKKDWFSYALALLAIVSIGQLSFLAFEVHKARLLSQRQQRQPQSVLREGERLNPLRGQFATGEPATIDLSGEHLFFVYSSGCPYCKKNWNNWKEIERRNSVQEITYVTIDSLDDTQTFAKEHGIPLRHIVVPAVLTKVEMKLSQVPQTILVTNGVIQRIDVGVLSPEKRDRYVRVNSGALSTERR